MFRAACGFPSDLRGVGPGDWRDASLCAAAAGGFIGPLRELLKMGVSGVDCVDYLGYSPLTDAAWGGHAAACEELVRTGAEVNFRSVDGTYGFLGWTPLMFAADGGHRCSWAAEGGHLEVLQWAREHDCPWSESTCICAAEEGHLEVLRWAREHGCP